MALSTSSLTLLKCFTKTRARLIAVSLFGSVLLWDASAYALNAFVSQDLPVLIEIAATEASSYGELSAILAEAAAIVSQVTEYTDIAKVAWGAIEELRHMTLEELGKAALTGLGRAFPEVADIYGDVESITDLDRRDPRAMETLRGMLWEHAYGPGIDYLHEAHGNLDAVATMEEHRIRQTAKVDARRKQALAWEEDCQRTSANGVEGACQAAANRAEIQQALMLADMHETTLHVLDAQRRQLQREDRKELDDYYAFERWTYDLANYMGANADPETCRAGQCLYERYAHKMAERVSEARRRHPRPNRDYRLPINDE